MEQSGFALQANSGEQDMNRLFVIACGLAFALNLPIVLAQSRVTTTATRAAAVNLARGKCFLCHGEEGKSLSPLFPRLAGQQSAYVVTQLKAFKNQTRSDPDAVAYMYGMASLLSDEMMKALGDYFQSLQPVAAKQEPSNEVSAGKEIFDNGIAAKGLSACRTCHGPTAAGAGQFPRLAGQHVAYIVKQLRAFKSGVRASPVMNAIASNLTEEQMQDIAAYVRSLP
jgi:cytochrome c553